MAAQDEQAVLEIMDNGAGHLSDRGKHMAAEILFGEPGSFDGDVSEAQFITKVARRTVLSDNAMSVLIPVMEEVLRWDSVQFGVLPAVD